MSSTRNLILENIRTSLAAVTGVSLVTRQPLEFGECSDSEFPALIVVPAREEKSDFGTREVWHFNVDIWGYVRDDFDIGAALETHLTNTWDTLKADPERGDLAGNTEIVGITTGFWDKTNGVFLLEIRVTYYSVNNAF